MGHSLHQLVCRPNQRCRFSTGDAMTRRGRCSLAGIDYLAVISTKPRGIHPFGMRLIIAGIAVP